MSTINVLDSAGLTVAIEKPLTPGRAAAATSRPIALSTEDKTALDALATQTTAAAILAKIIAAPATEAKQDAAITQETAINTVLGTTAGAAVTTSVAGTIQGYLRGIVSLLVSGITVATHAVTQSGTWTVQPGNTANTTAWKVDGSAVTQPVSLASVPSHAVTNAGTFAVQSSVADGANVAEGAVADAVVAAGASGSISAKLRAISRDIVANIVLAAGSNLIGRAVADASAATGGIPSIARLLSAAGTSGDATNVKASAGRVYWIRGTNVRTSAVYLKLYNSASAPTAGSGTPVDTIYLPPSGSFVFDFPVGVSFSAGIGFTLVTGGADNSSTSVTAGDILALSIGYA